MKILIFEHVDALCNYCQYTLQFFFENIMKNDWNKKNVMRFITRKKIQNHFEFYRQKMLNFNENEQKIKNWMNVFLSY